MKFTEIIIPWLLVLTVDLSVVGFFVYISRDKGSTQNEKNNIQKETK